MDIILIEHIENPYQFWFKYESGARLDSSGSSVDSNLRIYAEKVRKSGHQADIHTIHVGDYVAALIDKNNEQKWIRGYLKQLYMSEQRCIVWCIDNGQSFQVAVDCLVLLSNTEFASQPTCGILKGGLCDSRPGRLVC